ncbi:(2Fe-2S)-binding protein [Kitasatospora sp. NPDC056327]|uniref:(2Fe-2S)-binding protein n=1 Tax=Kitasatospora sp. NPDC056327 TaxID=3345785 RepID=UPI0035DCB89A
MSDMPDYGRLAAVGPYFALAGGGADEGPPPGFRPLAAFYAPGPDGPLADRVREVAGRLGTAEPRVAASVLHLGLAARICSVGLGAAVLLDEVPRLEPDRAWIRVPDQGPVDLWVPYAPASADRTDPLADRFRRTVVEGQLADLAAAVRAVVPLSDGLLRGNAASALAGALRILEAHTAHDTDTRTSTGTGTDTRTSTGTGTGTGEPATRTGRTTWPHSPSRTSPFRPSPARALVADVLDRPPLAGTGTLTGTPSGTAFRRTSCCLYYRIGPRAGVCGDCCFTRPPARR